MQDPLGGVGARFRAYSYVYTACKGKKS